MGELGPAFGDDHGRKVLFFTYGNEGAGTQGDVSETSLDPNAIHPREQIAD